MRFSAVSVALVATIGSAIAVDIGKLKAVRSTLRLGDIFVVDYNATGAIAQPQFVDLYIHDGQTNTLYQLGRYAYPDPVHPEWFEQFYFGLPVIDSTAPTNGGYVAGGKYDFTALITYPVESGALTVGRINVPLQFVLD